MMKKFVYLAVFIMALTVVLLAYGKNPDAEIGKFTAEYLEYFKRPDYVLMRNMYYQESGIEAPRLQSLHKNILSRLGKPEEVKNGRIVGYDCDFNGNIYDVLHDVKFEKGKGIYGLKVLGKKNKFYMVGWYVDFENKDAMGTAGSGVKEMPVTSAVTSYPVMPYTELIFPQAEIPISHSPCIIQLDDGGLFAVWHGTSIWGSDAAIWGSMRPAGASRWKPPFIVHDTPGLADQNPVLYLGRDRPLRLFWATAKRENNPWLVFLLRKNQSKWCEVIMRTKASMDSGYTWEKAVDVSMPHGFLARTHLLRVGDKRVVFPVYSDLNASSAVIISEDDGLTWSGPRYILRFLGIQPTIIQRSDSSLFALMRSGLWPHKAWQAASFNIGRSWSNQRPSDLNNSGASLEMVKLRNGHVAAVFNDSKKDRSNLSLALSYDEGKTWPHIRVIEKKNGYCYPSIIQDSAGLIHVLYSWNEQNGIAHFVTDEEWIAGKKL